MRPARKTRKEAGSPCGGVGSCGIGSGAIIIAPGASLTIYTAGDVSITGGGVANGNLRANSLSIYGLPTCTTVFYAGGTLLYAVINAPEAFLNFNSNEDLIGSFTANTVKIAGGGRVHVDVGLDKTTKAWVVLSWNEMPVE